MRCYVGGTCAAVSHSERFVELGRRGRRAAITTTARDKAKQSQLHSALACGTCSQVPTAHPQAKRGGRGGMGWGSVIMMVDLCHFDLIPPRTRPWHPSHPLFFFLPLSLLFSRFHKKAPLLQKTRTVIRMKCQTRALLLIRLSRFNTQPHVTFQCPFLFLRGC